MKTSRLLIYGGAGLMFAMSVAAIVTAYARAEKCGCGPTAIGIGLGAIGALLGASMLLGLIGDYSISWEEDGIEGPVSLWPPKLTPPRGRIGWAQIKATGKDKLGNWFVEDADGRRIVWNWSYAGYLGLMRQTEAKCPWLVKDNPVGAFGG